jgi:hypothetical protein
VCQELQLALLQTAMATSAEVSIESLVN